MTIDMDATYRHRKKDFLVIVGPPAWWDLVGRNVSVPADEVLIVYKLAANHEKWRMKRTSFLRLYEKVPDATPIR